MTAASARVRAGGRIGGVAALIAAALAGSPAEAADEAGRFAIKGAGRRACAEFSAARAAGSPDLALYGGWLEGYLSGANQHMPDTFDLAPWQTTELLLGVVAEVCARRPEARILDVANLLIREFLPDRARSQPEIVTAQVGDAALLIYGEVLDRVAARLAALGHDAGAPEGRFTPALRAALEAWQRAEGLEPTGLPDQRTLFTLLLAPRLTGQAPAGAAP